MLSLLVVLTLSGGRTFDWPSATKEFELLEGLSPVALNAPSSPFVKLGGVCVQAGRDGKVKLGNGSEKGHEWVWTAELRVVKGTLVFNGPHLMNVLNRKGQHIGHNAPGPARKLGIGAGVNDVWPLYAEVHQLELLCAQSDESSAVCGGKTKTCKKCSTVQLMNGPRPGLHNYVTGLARPAGEETCENLCTGQGLTWPDFEALAAIINRTAVIDTTVPPVAQMFRTKEACEAAKFDFDATFKPLEPDIPRKP